MPFRFQINHPERMVVGVAEGVVTLEDLVHFTLELAQNKASSYRKIIDVMRGTAMLSEADFVAYHGRMKELPAERRPTGPLAIVTSEENSSLARLFAETTSNERPVRVFASIHDARKWLGENPKLGTASRPMA